MNIQENEEVLKIKVIGIGGAGNNTLEKMLDKGIKGIHFVVANTDIQQLKNSPIYSKLHLGISTKGLGAGANPEVGRLAAVESKETIKETVKNCDMVIIAAGMGGGTGTGASPIIAKYAKESGALVVGIVTTPFGFEGKKRAENANYGIEELEKEVDSLIVVSNEKLLNQFGSISIKDAFIYADSILENTVRTITDLLQQNNFINLDFADVLSVMKNKGRAIIGIGKAKGEDRAIKAATYAIASPLLESSIFGAKDVIVNVASSDISIDEAKIATETIEKAAGNSINVLLGISIQEHLKDSLQVSIIGTGNLAINKNLELENIKNQVSSALENIDLNFENFQTKEILIEDPFPQEATEEFLLDPDLPSFLKKDN